MRRALVQFDGSNFYNKVKTLLPGVHLTHFDYAGLASFLAQKCTTNVAYYVGEIKLYPGNKKSQQLYSSQQSLFSHLRTQKVAIKTGYLLQSKGVFHEKGVDVRIAVDMAVGAVRNEYDVCYLISSDTDLIPAIETAQEAGKKVVYVGFKGAVSQGLKKNCSSYVIVTPKDLKPFFS